MNISVKISASINPTEMQNKVEEAILNFFNVDLALVDDKVPFLQGEGGIQSLRILHDVLRREKILDTARHVMKNSIQGNSIRFKLNKQVAFAGKLNFPAGEESLGSICVEISSENEEDLLRIIDWLAPHTIEGKPVMEIDL